MSNEDDRPRSAGDYADSGLFTPGSETYSSAGYTGSQDPGGSSSSGSGGFDTSGYSDAPTSVLPGSDMFGTTTDELGDRRQPPGWHAGADLGLLVLRLVVGPLFVAHGLQKLFGWFDGPGIDGFARMLAGFGYSDTTALSWVTGLTELVGGTFVALGLFTPAGAAALLGVMANVIWVKIDGNLFAGGVELESVYAAAAFAVLFAGPGRVSLDRPTPWYRNSTAFGVVFLLIAAAATVTMLVVFR